jgi:small subunit ribosomal protein S21
MALELIRRCQRLILPFDAATRCREHSSDLHAILIARGGVRHVQRRRKKPIRTGLGVNLKVAEVIIQESESLENALRRFKRKVQQEDIIKEIKKHSFYMKPGEKRRAKEALSRKRLRKKQRREAD